MSCDRLSHWRKNSAAVGLCPLALRSGRGRGDFWGTPGCFQTTAICQPEDYQLTAPAAARVPGRRTLLGRRGAAAPQQVSFAVTGDVSGGLEEPSPRRKSSTRRQFWGDAAPKEGEERTKWTRAGKKEAAKEAKRQAQDDLEKQRRVDEQILDMITVNRLRDLIPRRPTVQEPTTTAAPPPQPAADQSHGAGAFGLVKNAAARLGHAIAEVSKVEDNRYDDSLPMDAQHQLLISLNAPMKLPASASSSGSDQDPGEARLRRRKRRSTQSANAGRRRTDTRVRERVMENGDRFFAVD